MDADRFDRFTLGFANPRARRDMLKSVVGLAGLAGLSVLNPLADLEAEAQRRRKKRKTRRKKKARKKDRGGCIPNCEGKPCGAENGCGATCNAGSCPSGQSCQDGSCLCKPEKACGSNCCQDHESCFQGTTFVCCDPNICT